MGMRVLSALCLALLLVSCGGKKAEAPVPVEPAPTAQDACLEAWTYAPGNFVLDVAEGADVFLVPEVQDFPLYCTPAKARAALQEGISQGALPEANGGWALYRVEGVFHDIARADGDARFILKHQARLVDWSY